MSDLLADMAKGSANRAAAARARTPEGELRRIARERPPAPRIAPAPFILIAEVKRSSPSVGTLSTDTDPLNFVVMQAQHYVTGGASVISVLTEPSRFGGDLAHAAAVAKAVQAPVMRKDFLVDPYQIWEARAAGCSGVLLIARMLSEGDLSAMLDAADEAGLFSLIEVFDAEDISDTTAVLRGRPTYDQLGSPRLMVGVNTRDLRTLHIDPSRLESLASKLPPRTARVAESGIESAADIDRAVRLGYTAALVGTALMRSPVPAAATRDLVDAGLRAAATLKGSARP